MGSKYVTLQTEGSVATLLLNRPRASPDQEHIDRAIAPQLEQCVIHLLEQLDVHEVERRSVQE